MSCSLRDRHAALRGYDDDAIGIAATGGRTAMQPCRHMHAQCHRVHTGPNHGFGSVIL